ncbi:MAG: hypothetical protein HS111_30775 [Kofleriaceae bacterium]|nr:hypothetical protein [Kofleriaceae bacterium]MCL4226419.1 hypothetical protein [Myxococcales bacterium]
MSSAPPPPPPPRIAPWPAIRAGLIALAIAVGLLDGCPIPTASERPIMERRLTPGMVDAVDALDRVRLVLLRPFRRVGEVTRLRQRWKLFSGASRHRFRMRVEARSGPTVPWQLVYRVGDDEHAFMASAIQYRRVRGAWSPHTTDGNRAGFPSFVRWIGAQVFARYPEHHEVRVIHEKIVIGPRGGYRATGELVDGLMVRRADVAAVRPAR